MRSQRSAFGDCSCHKGLRCVPLANSGLTTVVSACFAILQLQTVHRIEQRWCAINLYALEADSWVFLMCPPSVEPRTTQELVYCMIHAYIPRYVVEICIAEEIGCR